MGPLDDKTAIVTGGAGQIGRGVVRAVAEAGARVAVVDMNGPAAEEQAADLREAGHRAVALGGDLTDRAACTSVVDRTVEAFGGVDILVNLAQQFQATFVPFTEVTDEDMRVSWESGVMTSFRMMQLCHPHLVARGGGSIVNFGSGGGTAGTAGMVSYGSAKEGIRLLTRVASWEWGPAGIRVNTICPFAHDPGKWDAAHWLTDELLERIPLRRDGDPYKDIGAAIVYLAGPGEFVTGQTLFVDGGAGFYR
jgi:NAD(P)-dependent dehydrogenase (short-subunit alcohol dehydrogenase family)